MNIEPAESAFTSIHKTRIWDGPWHTTDGGGSGELYTRNFRANLVPFLKKHNVTSMLDASCGEFNWMRLVDLQGIKYIGGEIVPDKIRRLNQEFPNHDFRVMNVITDTLPDVDLWMCRDTLFHFPIFYLQKALKNFANSNIKYLFTSSHSNREGIDGNPGIPKQNNEITRFGDVTNLNLQAPPYNFPAPLDALDDTCYEVAPLHREMLLYDRETIANLPFLKLDIPEPS